MIAFAICMFAIGLVAGFGTRHALACHRFSTFDGGATWFRGGKASCPVVNIALAGALKSVARELTTTKAELGIEVIL